MFFRDAYYKYLGIPDCMSVQMRTCVGISVFISSGGISGIRVSQYFTRLT